MDKLQPRIIISYNYNYIIPESIIRLMKENIVNLHISYLPWNRGAAPNFWSFMDNTPKGVSIHLLDKGLDTGNIIIQKQLYFDEGKETFCSSYFKLHQEIIKLFKENWEQIDAGKYIPIKQCGDSSYHTVKEFHEFMQGKKMNWNMIIQDFKKMVGR